MKPGNLAAWGSAQLFFVLGVLAAVVFAVLSGDIAQGLRLGEPQLGLLGGVFFAAYAVSQLVLGIALDRVPARLVLAPSALAAAAGAMLFAASDGLATAVAARVLMGAGLGSTFVGVIFLTGRRYGANFAFMAPLAQGIANAAAAGLALAAGLLPSTAGFRIPFLVLGVLLLATCALILLFVDDTPDPNRAKNPRVPLRTIAANPRFWSALMFYCGTFGTLLAFADLWNIQFQTGFFRHTIAEAARMNAAIPLGVTLGGLAAGLWAARSGINAPARFFAFLTVLSFMILLAVPLSAAAATAVLFMAGCGFGCSPLALAALRRHLPAPSIPAATSLVVTAACLFGALLQTLTGDAAAALHPGFPAYQHALVLFLASTLAAAAAFPMGADDRS